MWTRLRRSIARAIAMVRAGRLDEDFERELESHVAMLSDEYVRRGMSRVEATRMARLRVGGLDSLKARHRDARGVPALEEIWRDLRFAGRRLAKEPWFSGAAILALALGIGANATGFTIVNAAFLRGLPFDEADRLYLLTWQIRPGRSADVSYPELQDWRAETRSFDLAAFTDVTMNFSDDRAAPQRIVGTRVTANMLAVLRQQPALGRHFTPDDERPGSEPVVLIGDSLWSARYGRDPAVLGRDVRLDGQAATIVGVMPAGFAFPERTDVWVPFIPTNTERLRKTRSVAALGRLRDGVPPAAARAEMDRIGQRLRAAYPDETDGLAGIVVETVTEAFVGDGTRTMFIAVMSAVVFVLLIACANVATLLLSRSAARAREMALRMSIGATRWRVVRQLLIETLMLAILGSAAGLLLAGVAVERFEAGMQGSGKPFWMIFTIDARVFAYVAGVCIATAVLSGLAPALHASQTNNYTVLKDGGRGTTGGPQRHRFSGVMVVVQIALTVVLLGGAGMMIRSFLTLYRIDPGIDTNQLFALGLELPETKYPTADNRRAFFARLLARLDTMPGIEQAALTTGVPPFDGGERLVEVEGAPAGGRPPFVSTVTVSPGFFDAVRRPVIRGRGFRDTDGAPGAETIIVNQRLAAELFGGANPIGRRLRFVKRETRSDRPPDRWRTVVGVSAPIRHGSVQDAYLDSVVYIPYRQEAPSRVSVLVRSIVGPRDLIAAVRREVQTIDFDQPIFGPQTIDELMTADRWPYRVFGTLFGVLAVISLVLSSLGLYALMAYAVARRTQEIGVRMAMGAGRGVISWLVLKRGAAQFALAVPLGLAGALMLGIFLEGMLVQTSPADPATLVAVIALLLAVLLAACVEPVRRATRIDPVDALRAE